MNTPLGEKGTGETMVKNVLALSLLLSSALVIVSISCGTDQEQDTCKNAYQHISQCLNLETEISMQNAAPDRCDDVNKLSCQQIQHLITITKADGKNIWCKLFGLGCPQPSPKKKNAAAEGEYLCQSNANCKKLCASEDACSIVCCMGKCINIATNAHHCGMCGFKCELTKEQLNAVPGCTDGDCDMFCAPGYRNADGDFKNGCEKEISLDLHIP